MNKRVKFVKFLSAHATNKNLFPFRDVIWIIHYSFISLVNYYHAMDPTNKRGYLKNHCKQVLEILNEKNGQFSQWIRQPIDMHQFIASGITDY